MRKSLHIVFLFVLPWIVLERASAQGNADPRAAAAEAYDRGTSAFLGGDYAAAADWFETAHRLYPAAQAWMDAIRAHDRAGNQQRAATLALRLADQYPDDRTAQRIAQRHIARAEREYVRVRVACEGCSVDLDGMLQEHPEFFLSANSDHRVSAVFPTGTEQQTVRGSAGQTIEISFQAPAPSVELQTLPDPEIDSSSPRRRIPGWGTATVIGATAVVGAVAIWSGIDTLAGVEDYEAAPTMDGLADGQRRERRTNVLIGVTAGLGTTALLMAIFTQWQSPEETGAVRPAFQVSPEGAQLDVEGQF